MLSLLVLVSLDVTHGYFENWGFTTAWTPVWWETTPAADGVRELHEKLLMHKIVPNIVPKTPPEKLEIIYPSQWKSAIHVTPGDHLVYFDVNKKPPFLIWNCNPKKYYLLLVCDPDDVTVGLQNQHHIWVVGNIYNCSVEEGEHIIKYHVPDPSITGLSYHKIIFTMYEQPNRIHHFPEKYGVPEYAGALINHNLMIRRHRLSDPISCNFFLVELHPMYGDFEEDAKKYKNFRDNAR